MNQSDWTDFTPLDLAVFNSTRDQFHHAIQFVSAVGRKFSNEGVNETAAVLTWVPGLKRLASNWVEGKMLFRASISFEDFSIYLVDGKVNTISSLCLQEQTQSQILLWLEEQIGKLELDASDLTMNLPYQLPDFPTFQKAPFSIDQAQMKELSKYFHNTYLTLKDLGDHHLGLEDVTIRSWPKRFDQAMTILVKETGESETNSNLVTGVSIRSEAIKEPFFYIRSKPHVDIHSLPDLEPGMEWYENDIWTGAILRSSALLRSKSQHEFLGNFYQTASDILIERLKS
ncbi:hypothetical protein [Marinoscillum sp. MHG1-6]|uniref:hypothetical protein n=1 Tax=Marinoscillum sp. MHG1-6 TaxID=2959627 RepID=UPI0021583D9E|nr:hypothetical protein [Marinoscillum sp. MHG1-6]